MNKKPFWENSYERDGSPDTFKGGEPSSEFYELIGKLPTSSKILDLGCGDGRNSIFLAEQGYDVSAVDSSKKGLNKLKQNAEQRGLNIKI